MSGRLWTMMTRIGAPIAAALVALTLPPGSPAAAAEPTAGRVTPLPFDSFADIAVHPTTGRVFLTGGDQLVVTNSTGRPIRSLAGQTGAANMDFSDNGRLLYVALNDARAISVIDVRRLTEVRRFDLGDSCPHDLSVAGGTAWFTSSCADDTSGRLGSLDLRTGVATVQPGTYPAANGKPLLTVVQREGWPDHLVVFANELSASVVHYYELSTGQPVPSSPRAELRGLFRDVAVTADGRTLVVANLAQDHQVFPLGWSSPASVYPTDRYPNAVALGTGDLVAAGVETDFGRGNDLYVYPWGAQTPAWTYRFGMNAAGTRYLRTADRGLAWAPENRRLYAVSVLSDGTSPQLHTLIPPPPQGM